MPKYNYYDEAYLYIAYYKNKAYIAGYDKKLVRVYMEEYRKLKRDQYRIERMIPNNLQLLNFESIMLTYYEGFYLSAKDVLVISIHENDVSYRLKKLCQDNFDMCKLIGQMDNADKYTKRLLDTCKMLTKLYYNKKFMSKLQEISIANDPLIYCAMDDYIEYMKSQEEFLNYAFHMQSICGEEYIRFY